MVPHQHQPCSFNVYKQDENIAQVPHTLSFPLLSLGNTRCTVALYLTKQRSLLAPAHRELAIKISLVWLQSIS